MTKQVKSASVNSVDEYLNALPETTRNTLEKVRKAIKSAAPKADEVISYRIPIYIDKGHIIAFAAFKNHCSLITMSSVVMKVFKDEISSYKTSGTTIHFPLDKPLPSALVKKIVKARIKENEEMASRQAEKRDRKKARKGKKQKIESKSK